MERLIKEFNDTFGDNAHASINGNELEITIGSVTLTIQLPGVVGVKSTGPLPKS